MSEKFPRILIIPIDNRPVCYDLPVNVASIFKGAEVFVPDINLLGGLNSFADINKLQEWTDNILSSYDIDIAVIALDTIAYGGLIPSRRSDAKFDDIKSNIDKFFDIFKTKSANTKIYAVSSIMRISNNNCNDEEKSYWASYGTDLFRFSYLSHKLLKNYDVEIESELIKLAQTIPFEVVEDYLDTRKRNFDINSYYLELVQKGLFEHIVFSQDDTAEFGFNVEEKELLQNRSIKEFIKDKVTIKTGADEMVLALLSKAFCDFYSDTVLINPVYFDNNAAAIVSKYEDVVIEEAVYGAIELCGGEVAYGDEYLKLFVNAPNTEQDELCLEIFNDNIDNTQADNILKNIGLSNFKYMIADVKKANGADNYLLDKFLNLKYSDDKFYGFAAWNTTGNTLGTVIATGIIKSLALKHSTYDEDAFKRTQYTRLLDDWAYQANVRKILRDKKSTDSVVTDMELFKNKVADFLSVNYNTSYSFPWDRTFEVKINID